MEKKLLGGDVILYSERLACTNFPWKIGHALSKEQR